MKQTFGNCIASDNQVYSSQQVAIGTMAQVIMHPLFNTEGPIVIEDHYHINPLHRLDWDEIQFMISAKKYFVLHAPRQTGKTTTLLSMMDKLNQSGEYVALYANIEGGQAVRNDIDSGITGICNVIACRAKAQLGNDKLTIWMEEKAATIGVVDRLTSFISYWCETSDKPCVLFLDEVDALIGDTLIALLRQIRAGYADRPKSYPQSIVLCGVRDIQDYRIHGKDEIITGGSAFNIKAASLRMDNFTQAQVHQLVQQHSDKTGQIFDNDIFDPLWQDTQGQPWLINALAHQLVWVEKANRDRSKKITLEDYYVAREKLIVSRATHLHQLSDKLKEPRVCRVIEPMLQGNAAHQMNAADIDYVVDLGLINRAANGAISIANHIYQEVIPRELALDCQSSIVQQQAWYIDENNHLNMNKLLSAFQQFFRENADAWLERFDYKEAAPQLLIQAFLQRIVNGGGRINREYALGRKRTDLIIEWPTSDKGFYGNVQRIVIELKILYGGLATCINGGLAQTADYGDSLAADQAHLVIFNRDPKVAWAEKIWHRQEHYGSWAIEVWGC